MVAYYAAMLAKSAAIAAAHAPMAAARLLDWTQASIFEVCALHHLDMSMTLLNVHTFCLHIRLSTAEGLSHALMHHNLYGHTLYTIALHIAPTIEHKSMANASNCSLYLLGTSSLPGLSTWIRTFLSCQVAIVVGVPPPKCSCMHVTAKVLMHGYHCIVCPLP